MAAQLSAAAGDSPSELSAEEKSHQPQEQRPPQEAQL